MSEFVPFAFAFACVYLTLAFAVFAGNLRFSRAKGHERYPFVSIVLCARNEEASLQRCLDGLENIDYPSDRMEFILVDDESSDRTKEMLASFASGTDNTVVLSTEGLQSSYPGKQHPLDLGIGHARGDFMFMIDADCRVEPVWIRMHLAAYDDSTGVVAGITGIEAEGRGLFAKIQNCDQTAKLATARGAAGLGLPLTVMGNNMSLRREAWEAVGGFEQIGPSIVEDVDLLHAIVRNTRYRMRWTAERRSAVRSLPFGDFGAFVSQRKRMLAVNCGVPAFGMALIGLEIVMTVSVISAAVMSYLSPVPFLVLFGAWILGNASVILSAAGPLTKYLPLLPVMFIFQAVYGIALGLLALRGGPVLWKGRRYERGAQTSKTR